MKKKVIIALICTALLVVWQNRTLQKQIATLSGPFNNWITVCMSSNTAVYADAALKNVGAHFKYERLVPFSGFQQKQVCYVKFIETSGKHPHSARYQCSGLFGSHADAYYQSLDLKPCKLYFNSNARLKEQFETLDDAAHSVETVQEAVEIMKK